MPTSRCACGPQVGYDYSLGTAPRQFNKPRCPCIKCKNRFREAEIAMNKQGASKATAGNCGQIGNSVQKGNPVITGPEVQGCSGVRGRCEQTEAAVSKQKASNTTAGVCGQSRNGVPIGDQAITGPGGLCSGCSVATTLGPDQRRIQPPGGTADPGIGIDQRTGYSTTENNSGRPSTDRERYSNQGQIVYAKSAPNHILPDYDDFDPADTSVSGGLIFAGPTYGRQSTSYRESIVNDFPTVPWQVDEQPCNVRPLIGLHGDKAFDTNRHVGRDTLGRPIDLLGTGVGYIGMCTPDVACDENCGYGTGCDKGCRKRPISLPGGASNRSSELRGPVGIDFFSNEQINCFLTFLLEMLGILVFFAICTITFWITLGYYIVQLVIDLKNADRCVKIAVAIILCLLVLAFCITLITNKHGSCCRHKPKGHKVKPKAVVKATVPEKGTSNKWGSTKSVKTTQCKKSTAAPTTKKVTQMCPNKSRSKSNLETKPKTVNVALLRKVCKRISPKAVTPPCKSKARYSDCQGRAIFHNSRRYAIPTEMKQPPAIVIWLRDLMCRLFRR